MKFDFTGIAPQAKAKGSKETIIERIDDGKVVPIFGNAFTDDLIFGSHVALRDGWCSYTQYPVADAGHSTAQVAQYASVAARNIIQMAIWGSDPDSRIKASSLVARTTRRTPITEKTRIFASLAPKDDTGRS